MSENKSKDYLEGNYDGESSTARFFQKRIDEAKSVIIASNVDRMQEEAEWKEKERIAKQYKVTGKELDLLYADYAKDDRFGEYLVDGAVLKCNRATIENFELPNDEKVVLEGISGEDNEECCYMIMHVSENPMSSNGLTYATVKDTVFWKNIIPPRCNCKFGADRKEEVEKIMADTNRNKNGVCRHLMKLNDEWDNMIIEGREYMTKSDVKASPLSAGAEDVVGIRSSFGNTKEEEVECITMASVLFCKHGGLIMPVKSGQIVLAGSDIYVTRKVLESVGFVAMTDESIVELNKILRMYDITSKEDIRHFLTQCVAESWYGKGLTEINWRDYPNNEIAKDVEYFNNKYKGINGNCEENDGYKFRGAGYLHLTGRGNYQAFSDYLDKMGRSDERIMQEGASVIAEDYAWEAAAWFWKNDIITGHNGTEWVNIDGSVEKLTYFVNRGSNNLEERQQAYDNFEWTE